MFFEFLLPIKSLSSCDPQGYARSGVVSVNVIGYLCFPIVMPSEQWFSLYLPLFFSLCHASVDVLWVCGGAGERPTTRILHATYHFSPYHCVPFFVTLP